MPRTPAHEIVDLVTLVLQHVPQRERMQHCALTCRSWRAAANLASSSVTRSIAGSVDEEQQVQNAHTHTQAWSLPGWLARHGRGISSLHIDLGYSHSWQVHMRLPLQQLQQLQRLHLSIHGSNVCTDTSSSSSNRLIPLAGSLTALVLQDCTLRAACGDLAAVTALTGLRRLHLGGVALRHVDADAVEPTAGITRLMQASVLQQMTHLTALSLADTRSSHNWESNSSSNSSSRVLVALAAVQAISRLSALQQLELAVEYCEELPALPASLRQLHIHCQPGYVVDSIVGGLQLSQLTGLQHLELQEIASFDIESLGGVSQLQHLVIDLPELDFIEDLLPVLASFTQLRHLYLDYANPMLVYMNTVDQEEWDDHEIDDSAFAALTASTQLTYLAVKGYLPADAGGCMFPTGHQLPQLRSLCLDCENSARPYVFNEEESFPRMVSACPALHSLRIANIVSEGAGLLELVRMSTLQELCCWGAGDTEVRQALAHMTQLRQLTLHRPTQLSDAGAMQLTALTALTSLSIRGNSVMTVGRVRSNRSSDDDEYGYGYICDRYAEVDIRLTSQTSLPDVWLQLRQLLAEHSTDGACLRPLLDEQQQANARQQEQLQQAQQQLQQAQDTIARLQAQLGNTGHQEPA